MEEAEDSDDPKAALIALITAQASAPKAAAKAPAEAQSPKKEAAPTPEPKEAPKALFSEGLVVREGAE